MLKRITLFAAIITLSFAGMAQYPGGGAAGRMGGAQANIGHFYGKVKDTAGLPVADATVLLLQNRFDTVSKKRKEVLVKGQTTLKDGDFSFTDLPLFGQYKLKISAVGFKNVEKTIAFEFKRPQGGAQPAGAGGQGGMGNMSAMLNAFDKDLGNITLEPDPNQLSAVTVTASKPLMRMDIDKKVFNVDKNIVSAGGTALDVMKNVPSVQVDIDGNVKLRNATPQIYIEGRPTTLSLDQIPADAIESVEVITNPSAKYDASGGNAGILNIILKKNRKTGYNGNLRAGVDKRGGINGGGDINIRQGKFNFTASAMINQMRNRITGTTDRTTLLDTPNVHTYQSNFNKTQGGFMFGRLGLDYFATNRTTFSISGIRVHGEFKPFETIGITTDSLFNSGMKTIYSERNSSGSRTFNASGVQAGMKHLFPKEGEEWTADLNFFNGKNTGNNLYITDYYQTPGGIKTGQMQQQLLSDGTNQFLTVQTDYVKPIKTWKIETGLRAQMRKLSNNNNNYIQDPSSGDFILVPNATSNYKNSDDVYAAYISVGNQAKDFGYQVGLRAESSDYSGELTNTGEKFSNSYPISLFPSVFLSQKLKNKQDIQLSYTRRINRPNFFQLIPFVDYSDPLNITRGNPALVPEFTNSLEMSYSKVFNGNNNFLASVYYKHTNNLITRYIQPGVHPVTGEPVLINTYINANSSYSYGAEFTSVNPLTKWWDLTSNINFYNSKINTDNVKGTVTQDALWSWFGKLNSNFKLPKEFSLQLSATYQSKTNLPPDNGGGGGFRGGFGQSQSASQGYIKPSYGIDFAVKKSFLKNNAASVTLSVSDIFRTRTMNQYSFSPYFVQNYDRIRDPQFFRLNFAYRFGKIDASLFKRKNMKSMGEGMQGATEGMQ